MPETQHGRHRATPAAPLLPQLRNLAWFAVCVLSMVGVGTITATLCPTSPWAPAATVLAYSAAALAFYQWAPPRWDPSFRLVVLGTAWATLAGVIAQAYQ